MTALVFGGVILLAMIGVSWYGWISLPGNARVPIHFGTTYNSFVRKGLGLVVHPAAGALVYVIFATIGRAGSANGRPALPREVIFPVVMCLLLVVQAGAIRVARRRSGL